jgi:hypothetical protein
MKAALPAWSVKRGVANAHLENKLVWPDDGFGENAVRNVPITLLLLLLLLLFGFSKAP